MDPLAILRALRGRYKVGIFVFLSTIALALGANEFLPKRYTAETTVMVDIRSPDPVSALLMPQNMAPGSMGTQLDILRSDRVGRKVVRMLNLHDDPGVKQLWREATGGKGKVEDWMADRLQKGIKVAPSRDSNMLTLSYQGGDPVFVTAVANALAQAYIEASVELKVEPARQYSQWFGDQAKVLRENVEKAQARLSDFQRKKGIVATDEALDYEQVKLRDLTTRLSVVQGEVRDAQSKQRSGARADALPEVMQNSVVQGLRTSINQLEVKMKESQGNLGERHPQYRRMEAELAGLRERLAAEMKYAANTYESSSSVGLTKEADIRAAIDQQTRRVLNMKTQRDEIAVLVRDVETAKRAYEAVTNRQTQSNLESQATRTNVSVLSPAVEPLEPSFPLPMLKAVLVALLAGIVLGIGTVVGLEMLDRRIRTAQDLEQMLQVPVLAVVERSRLPRPRRKLLRGALALPLK
jgi:succinoglycan biosynthesis transport protein ExoP